MVSISNRFLRKRKTRLHIILRYCLIVVLSVTILGLLTMGILGSSQMAMACSDDLLPDAPEQATVSTTPATTAPTLPEPVKQTEPTEQEQTLETVPEETEPEQTEQTQPTQEATQPVNAPFLTSMAAQALEDSQPAQVPLYFQTDYPNTRYGSGTIESSGCGITSLAMVATYLTGHEYLPDELADYFGGTAENNIARLENGSTALQLPWKKAVNIHETMAALKQGDIAIVLVNAPSPFTLSQHFIVLTGLTEDGRILVNDPYQPNYDKWDLKYGFEHGFLEYDILQGYQGAWIYDVSAMPEDPFIYSEPKPTGPSRYPGVELTWEEQQLLARVIWVEARGESAEGQQAVAEIVLNRLVHPDFPDTLAEVIYAEGQFRSVKFLDDAEPYQAQYDAIDDALSGPNILPMDVMYFASYPENEYVWGSIGGHIFCYYPPAVAGGTWETKPEETTPEETIP